MNHRLRFLPEVAGDVVAGSRWYEERSSGLGEDFAHMVYARSDEISRNPLACAVVAGGYRRGLLRRFPYSIYYVVEGVRPHWKIAPTADPTRSSSPPTSCPPAITSSTAATGAAASAWATTARSACAIRCGIINLCLWRPAHAAPKMGKMDEWTEYFCAVAHELARAISQSQLEGA